MKSLILSTYLLCLSTLAFAGDLKLHFQINEDYLICHTFAKIINNRPLPEAVKDFREELHKSFQQELTFLQGLNYISPAIIQRESSRLAPLIKKAKSLSTYPQLLIDTKKHLVEVEKEWQDNYAVSLAFMTQLARIHFDKTVQVFITHPEVFQGMYLEDNNIAWGRRPNWKNYATVYLWHEILHTYLPYSYRSHGLIELMTDDALRVHLNGGSFPPFTKDGHPELEEVKTWIFNNYWPQYLSSPEKNFREFERELDSAVGHESN